MGEKLAKKVLFISRSQYGYLVDYYIYCQKLYGTHNTHYICFDQELEKYPPHKVKVSYYKSKGKKAVKFFSFLFFIYRYTKQYSFEVIIIDYFPFCFFLLSFIPIEKMVLDIRTGPIKSRYIVRALYRIIMKLDSRFFKKISAIDVNLYSTLSTSSRWDHAYYPLPLGAEDKRYLSLNKHVPPYKHDIRMVYIGTFNYRELYHTIEGLADYVYQYNSNNFSIKYKIVGTGKPNECKKIEDTIKKCKLEDKICLTGFIRHDDLDEILNWANVGVSYVPLKKMYDFQPPTKRLNIY